MYVVSAFYNFCKIPTEKLSSMRQELLNLMSCQNVLGTVIIAQEGINGTICGLRQSIDKMVWFFKTNGLYDQIDGLSEGIEYKEHLSQFQVFGKSKVKIKKEIVTFDPSVDPTKEKGEYILAKDWDSFVADPSTIVIDTRNDYEVQEGTFKGSVNPKTINFVDFKAFVQEHLQDKKNAKIGMFCTGGVRCEKSTAYLKQIGFESVYHLKGGILRYLQEMSLIDNIIDQNVNKDANKDKQLSASATNSSWVGKCFVFDRRSGVAPQAQEHYKTQEVI